MSTNETSIKWQALRDLMKERGAGIQSIMWDTTGTHVLVRYPDSNVDQSFLVTDLVGPSGAPATQPVSGTVTANQGTPANWAVNLAQVAAAAISLGAKLAASSLPVAVATDQLLTLGQTTMANSVPVATASDQVATKQPATLIEQESLAPTNIAINTAETVQKTGSTVLALGQLVSYNLAAETILETGGGEFVYVALKGVTSGNYYAVVYDGESESGSFPVTQAEKINIVARNSDTKVACVVSGFWAAMSP